MAAASEKGSRKHGMAGVEEGELPRGFFRSEVIKNRHDPEIANRRLRDRTAE